MNFQHPFMQVVTGSRMHQHAFPRAARPKRVTPASLQKAHNSQRTLALGQGLTSSLLELDFEESSRRDDACPCKLAELQQVVVTRNDVI
jgi:hypothetical protein